MVRMVRLLTYTIWAGTLFFWFALLSLRMEYTRTRPQGPTTEKGQIHPVSGFYNKTVFVSQNDGQKLRRAYFYAYGLLGAGILGMVSVTILERRARRGQPRKPTHAG